MYALYGKLYLIIKIAFTDFLLLCCYIIYIVSVPRKEAHTGLSPHLLILVLCINPIKSNKAMNNVVFIYA